MSSEPEESTPSSTYELTCPDCGFETTVTGTVDDVFAVSDSHRETHSKHYKDHYVDWELKQRDG